MSNTGRVCANETSRGKGKTTRRGSTTNGERERERERETETENNTLAAILTAPYANLGHPVCSIVVREPENPPCHRRSLLRLKLRLSRARFASAHASRLHVLSHVRAAQLPLVCHAYFLASDRVVLSLCRLGTSFVTIQSQSRSRRKLTATGGHG